jgi:Acetyltransferases, including N-acetylases of ribosomal proteins
MNTTSPNCYEFVLQDKSTQKVFGNISLKNHDDISEIGWISNKEYWDQGYMTEGLQELIKHIKTECQIKKIYATCTEKNIGSYKVMEKIGMKLVEREENIQGIKQNEKVIYTKLRYELVL